MREPEHAHALAAGLSCGLTHHFVLLELLLAVFFNTAIGMPRHAAMHLHGPPTDPAQFALHLQADEAHSRCDYAGQGHAAGHAQCVSFRRNVAAGRHGVRPRRRGVDLAHFHRASPAASASRRDTHRNTGRLGHVARQHESERPSCAVGQAEQRHHGWRIAITAARQQHRRAVAADDKARRFHALGHQGRAGRLPGVEPPAQYQPIGAGVGFPSPCHYCFFNWH